jgi:putative membrane protein insertion efficiency factor
VRQLLVSLLRAYQLVVSPLYGQTCRYYPSCSAYAIGAIETHGAVKGSWLALRRLGRCHPWTPGGVDLVPPHGSYRWWGLVAGMDGSTAGPTSRQPARTPSAAQAADTTPARQGA